jgi:hypothetical protein
VAQASLLAAASRGVNPFMVRTGVAREIASSNHHNKRSRRRYRCRNRSKKRALAVKMDLSLRVAKTDESGRLLRQRSAHLLRCATIRRLAKSHTRGVRKATVLMKHFAARPHTRTARGSCLGRTNEETSSAHSNRKTKKNRRKIGKKGSKTPPTCVLLSRMLRRQTFHCRKRGFAFSKGLNRPAMFGRGGRMRRQGGLFLAAVAKAMVRARLAALEAFYGDVRAVVTPAPSTLESELLDTEKRTRKRRPFSSAINQVSGYQTKSKGTQEHEQTDNNAPKNILAGNAQAKESSNDVMALSGLGDFRQLVERLMPLFPLFGLRVRVVHLRGHARKSAFSSRPPTRSDGNKQLQATRLREKRTKSSKVNKKSKKTKCTRAMRLLAYSRRRGIHGIVIHETAETLSVVVRSCPAVSGGNWLLVTLPKRRWPSLLPPRGFAGWACVADTRNDSRWL